MPSRKERVPTDWFNSDNTAVFSRCSGEWGMYSNRWAYSRAGTPLPECPEAGPEVGDQESIPYLVLDSGVSPHCTMKDSPFCGPYLILINIIFSIKLWGWSIDFINAVGGPRLNDLIRFRFIHSLSLLRLGMRILYFKTILTILVSLPSNRVV